MGTHHTMGGYNMKFAVSIFTTLIIIIGAVLFVQYQVHSSQVPEDSGVFEYAQEIEVVYREGSLDIRHHFKNLPNQKIDFILPTGAQTVECFLETASSCDRLAEDFKTISAGANRTQSISYVIPLAQDLNTNVLLKNVFANLGHGEANYSTVHITTDAKTSGQWVTGLPLVGQQQLKLVNYAMFSGEGQVKDLFWSTAGITPQEITNQLTVYATTPVSAAFKEKLSEMTMISDQHFDVVQSTTEGQSYRMLFMQTMDVDKIAEQMMLLQVESMYGFTSSPKWLKEMVAAYLTETEPTNEKAKKIVATLTDQMSSGQLAEWKNSLVELQGKVITPQELDKKLAEIFGSSTNFISKNSEIEGFYPFFYIDARNVFVNKTEQSAIEIIYYEGRVLYKAEPLLASLGYKAYEGENGYYVNSETRVFRFPKTENFYVFNQRRYETASHPIVKVQNEYYVEETWMQRLFLVELVKQDTSIYLNTIGEQTE